MPPKPSN